MYICKLPLVLFVSIHSLTDLCLNMHTFHFERQSHHITEHVTCLYLFTKVIRRLAVERRCRRRTYPSMIQAKDTKKMIS